VRFARDGEIKRSERLPTIWSKELPFDIPAGWSWVRLQQLLQANREISYGVIKLGLEPKIGGVHTLRCSDVKPRSLDLTNVRRVSEEIEQEYSRTRLVGGEILLNIRGTLGGVALVPPNLNGYNVAREVAVIPIHSELYGPYLVNVMASPYFWQAILEGLRGIAYKGLNLNALRLFEIPLPPLGEQHRIVAKVDELMTLCDRLEAQLTTTQTESHRLLEAVLHEALKLRTGNDRSAHL
jgi:type I restriction enzyme, S subunit